MDKQSLLARCFGYDQFRPGQETLIDGILNGRDVFGIMPTGGGKSICYQLPALLMPGITLVVSPLISLMRDQVLALKAVGVPAAYINSTLSAQQMQLVYRNLRNGMYKIVYVAPERLDYPGFASLVSKLQIPFVAVDEAHCISQWGQDFRPSYLRIVNFIRSLPIRPVIGAYTATATTQVMDDVERILQLQDPIRMVTGFDRPNLFFQVFRPESKDKELLRLLKSRREKTGIIYCATRKKTEAVCELLLEQGYAATRYHAGLPEEERGENQLEFIHDQKTVMVATNAFGMGIDKSNVSYVIHYNMPKSMEAYYQEAGRAGRDGAPAECILLFSNSDITTAQHLINNSADNEEMDPKQQEQVRQQELARLETMVGYCKTHTCLRGYILEYFGQKHVEACGSCGNCRNSFELLDVTTQSQMILSCVKRIQDKLGYGVGASTVIRVLQGSRDRRLLEQDLNTLSTYGLMKTRERVSAREILEYLEWEGYLQKDPEFATLQLTSKAGQVLYHGASVQMYVEIEDVPEKPAVPEHSLTGDASDLYEVLRTLRGRLARKAGIPAYVVFSNATLADMARKQPRTVSQFRKVSGVGELKASWYAEPFLEAIRTFQDEKD